MQDAPYESLNLAIQAYCELQLSKLPLALSIRIRENEFFQTHDWDSLTSANRAYLALQYDERHDPALHNKRVAGEWGATMDANAWWLAESINPLHAAMLLSRRNPNTETEANAENNSSDEMVPEDYRKLKNIFEGATDQRKTLKEWIAYARERSLKIHSWIGDWEAWVAEVDSRQESPANNPNTLYQSDVPKSITKQQVITAFHGLHFNEEQWGKYLASPPKWLLECRTVRGTKSAKKHPTLWSPVLIAVALTENPRNVTIKKLETVFATHKFLTPWQNLWAEKSGLLR